MKKSDGKDNQLFNNVRKALTPLIQDPDVQLRISASTNILEIMQMSGSQDNQLCSEIIKSLAPLLQQNPEKNVQNAVSRNIIKAMEISDHNDLQLCKEIVQASIPIVQELDFPVRNSASSNLIKIVKINPEFGQEIIANSLSPLLQQDSTDMQIKNTVIWTLLQIMLITENHSQTHLIHQMTDILTQMLQEPENDPIKYHATPNILALMKVTAHYEDHLWKDLMKFLGKTLVLQHHLRKDPTASQKILELANLPGLSGGVIKELIPFFYEPDARFDTFKDTITSIMNINGNNHTQFIRQVISFLIPLLQDSCQIARSIALYMIPEIFESSGNTDPELGGEVINILIPLSQEPNDNIKYQALRTIIDIMERTGYKNSQLRDNSIKTLVQLSQDVQGILASSVLMELRTINRKSDPQLRKYILDLFTPLFEHSNPYTSSGALRVLSSPFPDFLKHPESFLEYLTHASKNVRNEVTNFLFNDVKKYLENFQKLNELFQRPASDLTVELMVKKLFDPDNEKESVPENFRQNLQIHLEKLHLQNNNDSSDLKSLLVSQINKIEGLEGPQIIELAMVIIGQEKISKDGSRRQELIEFAKEMLNIQLKYLTEEGLIWIQNNYEKLKSLSPESKIFYKRVFHKLVEDGQITSLEEDLIIKFINQGLTTSLTREGEIIFEGKRYKLFGNDIEFVLEKIAKNVIDQQQDILAKQYKDHEPIFRKTLKGGMIEAAADKKEVKSLVDSRHTLKNSSWLLTQLKSLKFNSEIILLEQRSAFGDHVIYHMKQQKFFRFYPEKPPLLEEIFGSYIYGEAYQGEVTEFAYEVGQNLLEDKDIVKPTNIEGTLRSKQIYFQQELLKRGNEDRNSAIEEELAKKLDNNRTVLEAKLKSFKLQDTDKTKIHDYYEGFISTFSSVYTSSQAIDGGKLSIDDGEDFFSPVNIFIQLSSLAPFGIGEILSGGLEAARSYIKSNEIKNEARVVKDIAIDAVELNELVSKIALSMISNQEQRKQILEAKDDDQEKNGLIDKILNLVNEKLEKLKNLAEKYTKMKNLFEKEIQTSPAWRLGEENANQIIKEWIDLKVSQPDLRLKPEEKHKKFVKIILGEASEEKVAQGNKMSPMQMTPEEEKSVNKSACCEIF